MFLTALMTLRNKHKTIHHTPRIEEMCELLMHYATVRARPDPVPKLKGESCLFLLQNLHANGRCPLTLNVSLLVEQKAVVMEQRVIGGNKKELGSQVNGPSLPPSAPGGSGWSKNINGNMPRPTERPLAPMVPSPTVERPKTAMDSPERRTSSELGSSMRSLSLKTPPRPRTAFPSHRSGSTSTVSPSPQQQHRHHNSLQLPPFRSSSRAGTRSSTPTTPTSPVSPTSPSYLASMPRVTSPSPQKGPGAMLTSRPRRSSFTGGYATYADPALPGHHLQRSLSPNFPQSPPTMRSMSPSSFTSNSSTSSFSGSPPLSRVASPDPSVTFGVRTLRTSSRSRTPSMSSNLYGKSGSHQAAANGNFLGMAVSGFPRTSGHGGRTFKISNTW